MATDVQHTNCISFVEYKLEVNPYSMHQIISPMFTNKRCASKDQKNNTRILFLSVICAHLGRQVWGGWFLTPEGIRSFLLHGYWGTRQIIRLNGLHWCRGSNPWKRLRSTTSKSSAILGSSSRRWKISRMGSKKQKGECKKGFLLKFRISLRSTSSISREKNNAKADQEANRDSRLRQGELF